MDNSATSFFRIACVWVCVATLSWLAILSWLVIRLFCSRWRHTASDFWWIWQVIQTRTCEWQFSPLYVLADPAGQSRHTAQSVPQCLVDGQSRVSTLPAAVLPYPQRHFCALEGAPSASYMMPRRTCGSVCSLGPLLGRVAAMISRSTAIHASYSYLGWAYAQNAVI